MRDGRAMFREALRAACPKQVRVVLDGTDLSGEYVMVEAMNIAGIGPGLRLAQQADPGVGRLDVVMADAEHRAAIDAVLSNPSSAASLSVRRASDVTIEASDLLAHQDDELCDAADDPAPLRASVRRAGVTLLAG
jgi:hypothetical protein